MLTGAIDAAEQAVSEAIVTSRCDVAMDEMLVAAAKCAIQIDDEGLRRAEIPSGLPPSVSRCEKRHGDPAEL